MTIVYYIVNDIILGIFLEFRNISVHLFKNKSFTHIVDFFYTHVTHMILFLHTSDFYFILIQ